MKLIKHANPPARVADTYRRTVGVREQLLAEGAELTIPEPNRVDESVEVSAKA